MDNYSVATSWAIFGVAAAAGIYYYWPTDQRRGDRYREDAQHAGRRQRGEPTTRGRQPRRPSQEAGVEGESDAIEQTSQSGTENLRKRKVQAKEPAQAAPAVAVPADEPEEIDMSTKQWAEQMIKARKGDDLTSTKSKEQRLKTVKQNNAVDTPILSSGPSQADADTSPVQSPGVNTGDVSDMLEPAAAGPSVLRVTGSSKPQKEKTPRQPKEEVVETKKQRQNRQKIEERKLQQAADENARKILEEKQRRAAREARGEPAKNGLPASQAPGTNAWAAKPPNGTPTPSAAAPLLDTFDVESNSSSNGGQPSTAATSTSGGRQSWDLELPSEEAQLAQAMKQSEDESGWTTVEQPKKQKKKPANNEPEPILANKTNCPAVKPTTNGKPVGFQALDVQYEQRADADPSDASNWDA